MEGLLSLLLFAGAFYLMMRFGCGAHMVHGSAAGHGEHSDHPATDGDVTDPVGGMPVAPGQGYAKAHGNHMYRFCSRDCLDKFEADPGKYVVPKTGE